MTQKLQYVFCFLVARVVAGFPDLMQQVDCQFAFEAKEKVK